ncbi:MAG: hypothetical protein ACI8ZB_000289 [Desulforhopalus sp.]|jgi:hypothetical protein
MSKKVENQENTTVQDADRRKAMKTLVGGVTTIAAYNLLPSKWGTPYVESVFLPAHAATSGSLTDLTGAWSFSDNESNSGTITFNTSGTWTSSISDGTTPNGTYTVSGSTVNIYNTKSTPAESYDWLGATISADGNTITSVDGSYIATITRQ